MRRSWLITVGLIAFTMAILFASLVRHALVEAIRMRTYGRLSYLRLALANYEYAHGVLPPRQLADENGGVQFNWLVSVLPYIEQGHLQSTLDLSNSWDTPHNLDVAQSNSSFLDFITRDSYIACPLDDEESIWNPLTGLPNGQLNESPSSIVLIAVPMNGIRLFEPLSISKDELRVIALNGKQSFFIRSDGKCGFVQVAKGRVEFAVP